MGKLKKPKKPQLNIYKALDDFLFNNKELPDEFFEKKGSVNTALTFFIEKLSTCPTAFLHCEQFLNDKSVGAYVGNIDQKLDFFKRVIQANKINKFQIFNYFPKRDEVNLINKIAQSKGIPFKEAKAWYYRNKVINPKVLTPFLSQSKNSEVISKKEKTILEQIAKTEQNTKIEQITKNEQLSNDRFLKELNHQIIHDLELSLFDIAFLEKQQQFLYIFIDKDNNKRYYKEPFKVEFYISKLNGIVNNDFRIKLNDMNKDQFIKYIITDYKLLTTLQFALRNNYKQFYQNI